MSKMDRTGTAGDEETDIGSAKTAPAPRPAADPTDAAVLPGSCFGRYTIRERVGAGAMGEVFAAHDPVLDRMVALKMMRTADAGPSPEAQIRFQREAQAMARLNHPNVVSVFDVAAIGDRFWVAMELVAGPTLGAWLAERPRALSEVLRVFLEAGRGLEAAHTVGIVHRDFKPSNVLIGDRARVADFGLARTAHDALERESTAASPMIDVGVTQTGDLVGTPAYMSPEQLAGAPPTAASDQYAFCVALHEGVFGARPDGTATRRDVPGWLRRVIARGLERDPAARFPSMRALLGELGHDRNRFRRAAWPIGAALATVVAGGMLWTRSPPVPMAEPGPDLAAGPFMVDESGFLRDDINISRDGQVLMYRTATELSVGPRAGGPRRPVTLPQGFGFQDLRNEALSYHGDRVYALFVPPTGGEIWSIDVASGKAERRLTPASAPEVHIGSDSLWDVGPDGSLFVLPWKPDAPKHEIGRIDPAGAFELLATSDARIIEMAVSPDGAHVVMRTLRTGEERVEVVDVARKQITIVLPRVCRHVNWLSARSIACVDVRAGRPILVELILPPDGSSEAVRARDRYIAPLYSLVNDVYCTDAGILLGTTSLVERLGRLDLDHPGTLDPIISGSITDVAPAGWTPSGSLIFGANVNARLQVMAVRPDGGINTVHTASVAEVPLVVLGESIVIGRFPGGERTIPLGDEWYGRKFPADGELVRLGADGTLVSLGATHGFLSLRCAGDRAPPCLLLEHEGGAARAVRWDPDSGARGGEVAHWSMTEEGFHALAPDGRTLAHVVFSAAGLGAGVGNAIDLVDLETGAVSHRQTAQLVRELTFAPDGTLIAQRNDDQEGFYRIGTSSVDELWIASAAHGHLLEPRISPDGKTLVIPHSSLAKTYSWLSTER